MQLFCWVTFTLNVWQQRWTICDRGNHAIVIAQWFFFIRWTVLWWHHEVSNQGPLVQQLRTYPLGHSRCYCEGRIRHTFSYFLSCHLQWVTIGTGSNPSGGGGLGKPCCLRSMLTTCSRLTFEPCLALHCIHVMSCHVIFIYMGIRRRNAWYLNAQLW